MKHNLRKNILSLFLVLIVFSHCASSFAAVPIGSNSGSIQDSQFQRDISCSSRSGNYLNFWIRNNGATSVTITINGTHERTIPPGGQGHIYATLGYFSRTYTCKAVPAGGSRLARMDIDWRFAWRDSQ